MTVTVYVKPSCGGCIATKRHLTKLEIPYLEQPLTDQIRDQAMAVGVSAAPVVIVAPGPDMRSNQIWGGYRPDRLDALAS